MIRVISVVSNDIVTDNRVHKVATSLMAYGYHVSLLGRRLHNSSNLYDRPYTTKRFALWFNTGPLFYANLNLRVFFYLLRAQTDVILSNDLDTLPACWLAAKFCKKLLVFDSHELFPEVPELVHRPLTRSVWQVLERFLIQRVQYAFTVSPSIVEYYRQKYNARFVLVRNAGRFRYDYEFDGLEPKTSETVIIYQGALNYGRGLELAIESMRYIDHAQLWIVGDGDIAHELRHLAHRMGQSNRVKFIGKVPIEQLWKYTARASLGLSLEEDLGLNYRYALPNKVFDYLQARIPMVVSDLPEMARLVEDHKIGKVLKNRDAKELAGLIRSLIQGEEPAIQASDIELAARELCWEREEEKLIAQFKQVTALS